MVVEKGFGAFKNSNINITQYTRDVFRNIDKINNVTSLKNT